MKKVLIALIAVVCAAFYVFVLYDRMTADKTAPEITFEGELRYDPALEPEQLLEGVKAVDDKDGDVSASLAVESVDTTLVQGEAIITYIARDKNNNIGRAKRNVPYAESVEAPLVVTQIGKTAEESAEGSTADQTEAGAAGQTEGGEPTSGDAAPAADETQEAETVVLGGETFTDKTASAVEGLAHINAAAAGHEADADPNTPFVKLLRDSLEIESGEYVNIRSFVDAAYPEGSTVTTSPFALLRMIKIDGLDGQEARVFSTPGTYRLSIYVVDSQNNFKKSNTRTFTLTVK